MPSFNKVMLMGNLTRDPEIKYTTSGKAVASFSIAINSGTKEKPQVDYFDCEAWDKTAELCSQYLAKGSGVFIEGRLKQDRWEDERGQKRSRVKIVCNSVQFLGKSEKKEEQGQDWNDQQPPF